MTIASESIQNSKEMIEFYQKFWSNLWKVLATFKVFEHLVKIVSSRLFSTFDCYHDSILYFLHIQSFVPFLLIIAVRILMYKWLTLQYIYSQTHMCRRVRGTFSISKRKTKNWWSVKSGTIHESDEKSNTVDQKFHSTLTMNCKIEKFTD